MSLRFKVQSPKSEFSSGFTLLELIVTLVVLAILVMGTIPLMQNAVKRQKELRLREDLRTIRNAIDEFHRDTAGACSQGELVSGNPTLPNQEQTGGGSPDPRSRVQIADCKIFDTENLDRYPPSLEILAEGVSVKPRGLSASLQGGRVFDDKNATDLNSNEEKSKVYLREIPIDPFTGEKDWQLRSSFQTADDDSWDEVNVFDVRSNSDSTALNGENYSDW